MILRTGTRQNYRAQFLPTSGISSCCISQGKMISVNWLLCYRFFVSTIFWGAYFQHIYISEIFSLSSRSLPSVKSCTLDESKVDEIFEKILTINIEHFLCANRPHFGRIWSRLYKFRFACKIIFWKISRSQRLTSIIYSRNYINQVIKPFLDKIWLLLQCIIC